jgi:dTDP-4-dehydrorhamnose reductase
VAEFASYAGAVARRYPWIDKFLPINEPLTTARFGGLYGWWPPHARLEQTFGRLLLAQVLAIRAAARAIREVNSEATIIVNEDVGRTFCTEPLNPDALYLNERRWLTWDLLCGRVTPGHAMYDLLATTPRARRDLDDLASDPEGPDLLGVDHYVTSDRYLDHRVGLYPASLHDPLCPTFIDIEACRVPGIPGWSIARAISDTWRRYRLPIALTEISLAGQPDDQVAWWKEAWHAASRARTSGIDVRAVTAWAAFGATDWHSMMQRAEGVYEPGVFDVSHVPPRRRPVADAVLASAADIRLAASAGAFESPRRMPKSGWWTRPDRFVVTSPA